MKNIINLEVIYELEKEEKQIINEMEFDLEVYK